MAQFTKIAFTPSVKAIQTRYGSREVYANFAAKGVTADTLTPREIEFIQARDSFYLGTSNPTNPGNRNRSKMGGTSRMIPKSRAKVKIGSRIVAEIDSIFAL